MSAARREIEWRTGQGILRAFEPGAAEVAAHASALAAYYNEPYNRSMMGHAEMSAADVREHFSAMAGAGGRLFLLESDGELAGDADFRHLNSNDAEFAIMIGGRSTQGKGLGTRFAIMLHAFAFEILELKRVYITILEQNLASRRLFEKLGYQIDHSPEIRAHVDHDTDLAMSISRADFQQRHALLLTEIAL